jgi:hypothetical protein
MPRQLVLLPYIGYVHLIKKMEDIFWVLPQQDRLTIIHILRVKVLLLLSVYNM